MSHADISGLKHLRELASFAKEKLDLTKVLVERRNTSAKLRGIYTYNEIEHQIEVDLTLNTTDTRAHRNGKSDLVRAVNDLKDKLGVPVVRGISQVKKSAAPRPVVAVKKPPREKLTLFTAKPSSTPDAVPTRLDADPFESLRKLFAQLHPIPDTHVLWTLEGDAWKEDTHFISEDGIERRALTLLRMGKSVQIKWAKQS
jgi:hypothetical protein